MYRYDYVCLFLSCRSVCLCMRACVYVCVFAYVYIHIHGCMNEYTWKHCCLWKQMRACMYACMYVCMYIMKCTHVLVASTCIYIIHTHAYVANTELNTKENGLSTTQTQVFMYAYRHEHISCILVRTWSSIHVHTMDRKTCTNRWFCLYRLNHARCACRYTCHIRMHAV